MTVPEDFKTNGKLDLSKVKSWSKRRQLGEILKFQGEQRALFEKEGGGDTKELLDALDLLAEEASQIRNKEGKVGIQLTHDPQFLQGPSLQTQELEDALVSSHIIVSDSPDPPFKEFIVREDLLTKQLREKWAKEKKKAKKLKKKLKAVKKLLKKALLT